MHRLLARTQPLLFSGILALVGTAACGGDDDDDNADGGDDNGNIDAAPPEPDAAAPDAATPPSRSGTVAITETAVTNEGLPFPISGAVVSISFIDNQSVTVAPEPGFEDPLTDGCAVTVYNLPDDQEPTQTDEGVLQVTGIPSNGDFACAYNAAAEGYLCQSVDQNAAGGVPGNFDGAVITGPDKFGVSQLTLARASFPPTMQGMAIQLAGFPVKGSNGNFQIIQQVGDTTLLLRGNPVGPASSTGGAEATFATFVGAGPTLGGFNFLDNGTADITISKAETTLVPDFNVTANARGEGFALAEGSAQPHDVPTTVPAEDVSFSCQGDGCGEAGSGQIGVMIINGVTTDVLPAKGDNGITMLPAQTSYATFVCADVGDTVTIPAGAMDAILGTDPARMQITVGRFFANMIPASNGGNTNVVQGHSLTGFTTVVPPKLARRK